jgi:hypothetical protein
MPGVAQLPGTESHGRQTPWSTSTKLFFLTTLTTFTTTNHVTEASFNTRTHSRLRPARIAMRFTSLIFGAAALVASAAAHSIHLNPHARECFHENLHREDRMTVSYQVGDREFGSAGNLEIDFWASLSCNPSPPSPPKASLTRNNVADPRPIRKPDRQQEGDVGWKLRF